MLQYLQITLIVLTAAILLLFFIVLIAASSKFIIRTWFREKRANLQAMLTSDKPAYKTTEEEITCLPHGRQKRKNE